MGLASKRIGVVNKAKKTMATTQRVSKSEDMEMKVGAVKMANIIGIMFMSRTYAHMAHLKTDSYSKHIALNDFYDSEDDTDIDIVELADGIAEAAQGHWGKLDIPFYDLVGDVENPVEALEEHLMMIKEEADGCDMPYLENMLQEVEAFYKQTLYMLRELN
jgi:hypothetical protein